jgi:hypothetical protein
MYERDRLANSLVLLAALALWGGVVWVVLNHDPTGDAVVLLLGALLMGGAVALTVIPPFWLAAFVRNRSIAYRGDWWRATRRGLLVGLLITAWVVLLGQEMLSLPLALFILVMVVLVELTLSLRR